MKSNELATGLRALADILDGRGRVWTESQINAVLDHDDVDFGPTGALTVRWIWDLLKAQP